MENTKCPVCDWEIKDGGIKVTVGGKEIRQFVAVEDYFDFDFRSSQWAR